MMGWLGIIAGLLIVVAVVLLVRIALDNLRRADYRRETEARLAPVTQEVQRAVIQVLTDAGISDPLEVDLIVRKALPPVVLAFMR